MSKRSETFRGSEHLPKGLRGWSAPTTPHGAPSGGRKAGRQWPVLPRVGRTGIPASVSSFVCEIMKAALGPLGELNTTEQPADADLRPRGSCHTRIASLARTATVPAQQGTGGSERLPSLKAPAKDQRASKRQWRDLNPCYLSPKAHSALQGRTGRVTHVQRRGFGALAPRPTFLQTCSLAPVSGFSQQQSCQLPGPALWCFPPSPSASACRAQSPGAARGQPPAQRLASLLTL